MVAEILISNEIVPLKTSDTGEEALNVMSDYFLRYLPIVNNFQLLGILSEDEILDHDVSEPIGSYRLSYQHSYVTAKDHIYVVMRLLAESGLTIIPVVDDDKNYLGVITLEALLQYFAGMASFASPGSILVLEVASRDYSMSEIARIVESESALILSSFVSSVPESGLVEVTLKINRQNLQSVIATFVRFNYRIKASFNEATYLDSLKERYDALMSYLNV